MKIRSSLNGPIEFSVKSGNIKILRSKIQGKPEFLSEITEAQYKELVADKTGPFKGLITSGDLQVIKDHDEDADQTETESFTLEEVNDIVVAKLEEYKQGAGAELLQSSIDQAREQIEEEFLNSIPDRVEQGVGEAKIAWDSAAETKRDDAVKVAVAEVRKGLVIKHNAEKTKNKLLKW